jgi:general secretion pathway protein C
MNVVGLSGTVHDNRHMVSRFVAFVIWAAVAASIVFWALRLWAQPIAVPAHAVVVATAGGFKGDLGRVLGPDAPIAMASMAAAPVQADSRFRLIGVVAPRPSSAQAEGLALIATDGKPAKAYRVGREVEGELVLLGVHARGASLGPRGQPPQIDLQLPALPPPTTGTMPGSAGVMPVPRPALPLPPRPPAVQTPPEAVAPPDVVPEAQPEPGERPPT